MVKHSLRVFIVVLVKLVVKVTYPHTQLPIYFKLHYSLKPITKYVMVTFCYDISKSFIRAKDSRIPATAVRNTCPVLIKSTQRLDGPVHSVNKPEERSYPIMLAEKAPGAAKHSELLPLASGGIETAIRHLQVHN